MSHTPDELRRSFVVLDVAELPEQHRLELFESENGACCYHCEPDWKRIAAAAVQCFEDGIDPLDDVRLARRGFQLGLTRDQVGWMLSLFYPTNAIIWFRHSDRHLSDGNHRAHALRAAGVERVVVYTAWRSDARGATFTYRVLPR